MGDEQQKIYAPKTSAKQVTFNSGKSILKLGIHAETMIEFLRQHANEKGYVNLGISERREVGQYGDTHCVWLDTWKPNQQRQDQPTQRRTQPQPEPAAKADRSDLLPDETDSIPF